MARNRPITEDDVLLTELLLARSYGRLKKSVVRTSSDALCSVGDMVGGTVRKHPYASAGAAVGAGVLLYGLFRLMNRDSPAPERGGGKRTGQPAMAREILSLLAPVVMPYVTAYLDRYLKTAFSKDRRE